ncbi:hypothetical protein ArsFIN_12390 [Arsenophonus nasoniae]|uniref:Uncharacterized protein n=1 Tax=Arsenophonus nasoniae TaxID=638 RepID=A0A4P7KVP2_9GAMM|nr:hypothetical protein ArsFIN_12390 [Arsenophonus nasoniae]
MVGRTGLLGLRPHPAGRCALHNAVSLRSARTYTASHPVLSLQYIILVALESMKRSLDGGSYRITRPTASPCGSLCFAQRCLATLGSNLQSFSSCTLIAIYYFSGFRKYEEIFRWWVVQDYSAYGLTLRVVVLCTTLSRYARLEPTQLLILYSHCNILF